MLKQHKREEKRAKRKAEKAQRAEESSSRRRISSSSSSSESSTSSAADPSPRRSPSPKRSKRSATPQPPREEIEVVATKPAPREGQRLVERAREAATIPPLPAPPAAPTRPPTPPPQQRKPAAKVEPLGGKREASRDSSNERSFPAVHVQGRIKRGIQVKIPVEGENRRPAKERLGSPVRRDRREEVIEKLRELAAAGSSSGAEAIPPPRRAEVIPPPRRAEVTPPPTRGCAASRGAEATPQPARGAEDRHRRTTKEYSSVLSEEAYALVPVHLDDFKIVNDMVERMQTLRHPTLRNELITLRNMLLRRLNDQALGPEATRVVQSYCHGRK